MHYDEKDEGLLLSPGNNLKFLKRHCKCPSTKYKYATIKHSNLKLFLLSAGGELQNLDVSEDQNQDQDHDHLDGNKEKEKDKDKDKDVRFLNEIFRAAIDDEGSKMHMADKLIIYHIM